MFGGLVIARYCKILTGFQIACYVHTALLSYASVQEFRPVRRKGMQLIPQPSAHPGCRCLQPAAHPEEELIAREEL